MGKTAFLFPGQGSQRVGMGQPILEARPDVMDRYFEQAAEASGLDIRRLCLDGPIEELTRTDVAQPALFAVSLAMNEIARAGGLRPDYVAGHSLGEYTAAVAAGALAVDDGMRLVALRGRLMAAAQHERPGTMAAIMGLPVDTLRSLCEGAADAGVVAPANLNTPSQVVVSGEEDAVTKVLQLAEAAGAEKAVRLQVGAAFHSVLMEPTQQRMAEAMADVAWRDPEVPVASNASGLLVTTGNELRDALVAQIASPVLWVDVVETLVDSGADRFLELGCGRVLSRLVRQINRDVEAAAADSPETLARFLERV